MKITPKPDNLQQQEDSSIFVLWGDMFEEMMAAAFISTLREAGLKVNTVGLRGKYSSGKHGTPFEADLTLGQALPMASHADCVIVPCNSPHINRITNDPRVEKFLDQAHANNAHFVTGQVMPPDLELFPVPSHRVTLCLEKDKFGRSADEVAHSLISCK